MTLAQALAGGTGVQPIGFRYERRDHDYALIDDISSAVSPGGSVAMDIDRAVVRTSSLELVAANLPADFDINEDHIAVSMLVLVAGVLTALPLGLFHLDVSSEREEPQGRFLEVNGADLGTHLQQAQSSGPVTVAAGANIVAAIAAEIAALGINEALPAAGYTMPVARTWAPGTSAWARIHDLSLAINRYDPWPGPTGIMTQLERVDPATVTPAVWYRTDQEPRMVVSPYVRHVDSARSANRFATLIDHPARTPQFELRENQDPASPVSIVATGITTTEQYESGIIVDTTIAGEISEFELRDADSRATRATLRTGLDGRRDAHEVYQLTVGTIESGTIWRALGWTLELATEGVMTHQLAIARSITLTEP